MRKICLILILGIMGCAGVSALNVTSNTAGALGLSVSDKTATELTVTGVVDVRDIKFIADEMPNLKTLDLSAVQIVGYTGKTVYFADALEYDDNELPEYCFFDKNYEAVSLPSSLKYIGKCAFAGCDRLASVTFPTALDSIGDYAFNSCEALTSVVLPQSVVVVAKGAFSRCIGLKTVDLSVQSAECVWGDNVFANCTALESVILGNKIANIPAGMFAGCTSLEKVDLGENPALSSIGEDAFISTALATFDFEACTRLKVIGRWAFGGTQLAGVTLSASVESIGEGAFYYNTALKGITLPSGVTELSDFVLGESGALVEGVSVGSKTASIGRYAFSGSKMATISLPSSLVYIGDGAFADNTAMTEMKVYAQNVPELGEDVFAGMEQSSVRLRVPEESVILYRAAEQWKEFDIYDPNSGIEDLMTSDNLKIYFSDKVLNIVADKNISLIRVYEPGGVMLVSSAPGVERVAVDMSGMAGCLYVVSVQLENGKTKTVKLIRQ